MCREVEEISFEPKLWLSLGQKVKEEKLANKEESQIGKCCGQLVMEES